MAAGHASVNVVAFCQSILIADVIKLMNISAERKKTRHGVYEY